MKQFSRLAEFCRDQQIVYNEETEQKFQGFCQLLIEKNKVMNLTAVTEPSEIELKHFIDSASSISLIKDLFADIKELKVVDLGTGAGFPGIPLSILLPEAEFTLADALNKRIDFLKEVVKDLTIKNAHPIQCRAEELGQSPERESFDLCVSRAVADLTVLLEYCLPLVKVGGAVILYKSGDYKQELENAEYALEILGGELKEVREFSLMNTEIRRSLIVICKRNAAPIKYPRRSGKPSKSPLIQK